MYCIKKLILFYIFAFSFLKSMELKFQSDSQRDEAPKDPSMIFKTINTSSLPTIIKLATILKLLEITKSHIRENSIIFYEQFEKKVEDVFAGYQVENGKHLNREIIALLKILNSLDNFYLDEIFAKYIANCLKIEAPSLYEHLDESENLELLHNYLNKLKLGTFTTKQKKLILRYIDNTEIPITVKTLTGTNYLVEGSKKKKLKFLKRKLETLTGIPADRQVLIWKKIYILDEDEKISNFDFKNTELILGIKSNLLGEKARKESIEIAQRRCRNALNKGNLIIFKGKREPLYARVASIEAKNPEFFKTNTENRLRTSLISVEVHNGKLKDIQVEDIIGQLI